MNGAALFQSKGCNEVSHRQARSAEPIAEEPKPSREIATDMWDHQPNMKPQPPTFSQEEMRQLLSYIWARQYFSGNGDPAGRGKKVFEEKQLRHVPQ